MVIEVIPSEEDGVDGVVDVGDEEDVEDHEGEDASDSLQVPLRLQLERPLQDLAGHDWRHLTGSENNQNQVKQNKELSLRL